MKRLKPKIISFSKQHCQGKTGLNVNIVLRMRNCRYYPTGIEILHSDWLKNVGITCLSVTRYVRIKIDNILPKLDISVFIILLVFIEGKLLFCVVYPSVTSAFVNIRRMLCFIMKNSQFKAWNIWARTCINVEVT